ncbi:MAG: SAM-dependent methyltransferase [Actinomycetota bacterium]
MTVVGTGITYFSHITNEARASIGTADKVLALVADPATEGFLRRLNPSVESLERFYVPGQDRLESYRSMADEIVDWVSKGLAVCAVFYGHPGVFVMPAHVAIEKARRSGFPARMLPGISAEACLFADLGVDPGADGCQSFEATDFLVSRRRFDPTSVLLLWQVGVIGRTGIEREPHRPALLELVTRLSSEYGNDWDVVLYEAPQYPIFDPAIERTTLRELPDHEVGAFVTLYVPPKGRRSPDLETLELLGISPTESSGDGG